MLPQCLFYGSAWHRCPVLQLQYPYGFVVIERRGTVRHDIDTRYAPSNTTAGLSKVTVSTAPSHTCPIPFGWSDSGTDSLRKLMRVRMSKLSCKRSSRSKISTCCFFKVAKVSFSSAGFSSAGANGNFRNYRNYRFLFPLHPQKCGCPVPYGSSLDLETSVSVYDISTNGTP